MTAIVPGDGPSEGEDRIAVIVDTIRRTYGDDALDVARRQLEVAEGASRSDWSAIVERLGG